MSNGCKLSGQVPPQGVRLPRRRSGQAEMQGNELSFIHPLVQLEKLLMEKEVLDIINALFQVMPVNDQDELATSLVLIFGHNEADFTLLKWALSLEIAETGAARAA